MELSESEIVLIIHFPDSAQDAIRQYDHMELPKNAHCETLSRSGIDFAMWLNDLPSSRSDREKYFRNILVTFGRYEVNT